MFAEGPMSQRRTNRARPKRIIYWAFNVEITGPRYQTRAKRRSIHHILSRKLLRQIEEAARQTVKNKLPSGFRVTVS
jgi:hypothetical protein